MTMEGGNSSICIYCDWTPVSLDDYSNTRSTSILSCEMIRKMNMTKPNTILIKHSAAFCPLLFTNKEIELW